MIDHRVFVGCIGEGIFRSLDGGQTFARAAEGMFVECYVRALAVHPFDHRLLYAGTEAGLFRSSNGGDDWQQVDSPINGQEVWSILIPPAQPEMILVGTRPSRIWRSDDAGRNWRPGIAAIRQECPRILYTRVTTLKADPDDPQTFWAGIEIDGIQRSTDGGATWQPYSGQGLVSHDIHDLAIWRGNGRKVLLAATNADLHRSDDDGRSWQPLRMTQWLPWSYCRALALPLRPSDGVLLGVGNGPPGSEGLVAVGSGDGRSWRSAVFPGLANSTIWNFAVHPADPALIYASSVSGEVYRSSDGGHSWSKLAREFGEIRALAWTP
ncbi:MAG: hypothetical protein NZO58_14715 [Gemmataceae bacterium]|nr:hypothetical protein [Gemmataceae bacterium]